MTGLTRKSGKERVIVATTPSGSRHEEWLEKFKKGMGVPDGILYVPEEVELPDKPFEGFTWTSDHTGPPYPSHIEDALRKAMIDKHALSEKAIIETYGFRPTKDDDMTDIVTKDDTDRAYDVFIDGIKMMVAKKVRIVSPKDGENYNIDFQEVEWEVGEGMPTPSSEDMDLATHTAAELMESLGMPMILAARLRDKLMEDGWSPEAAERAGTNLLDTLIDNALWHATHPDEDA